ncbi:hypothetical protein Tco_1400738 [Tanacetum coccineum]
MGSITSLKCVLTQEHLDAICAKYFVSEEVHPQLPSPDATMHERPAGKVGMYTRFFDYANYRIPFSTFFVSVLTHFRIPFSQLFVFGSAKVPHFEIMCRVCNIEPSVSCSLTFYTHNYKNGWFGFTKRPNVRACYSKNLDSVKNWNDHFFWVDEFVVPANARFSWFLGSNIVKDRAPAPSEYNVEHVNTLIAQASPFLRLSCFLFSFFPVFGPLTEMGFDAFIRNAGPRIERTPAASHPPKRLRADYGTTGGSATRGKSPSVLNRSAVPVITEATTVTTIATTVVIPTDVGKDKSAPHPSVFGSSSSSEKTDRTLSLLQEGQVVVLPPGVFVRRSWSSEVRMRAEYNILEKRKWKSLAEEKDCEVASAKEHNGLLEQECGSLKLKVTSLESIIAEKDRELSDLGASSSSLRSQNQSLVNQVHGLETSSADLREKLKMYEGSLKWLEEFQDNLMRSLETRLAEIDADFTRCCMRFQESFHPHLLNVVAGRRWLLTHGMKLLMATRCLTDLEAYISFAEVDFNSAVRDLRDLDFPLLQELSNKKDASTLDVMDLLRLDDAVAEALGMTDLQPDMSQLMVPVHHKQDRVVIGSQALSVAFDICSGRVEKMERNLIERLPFLKDVFVSLDHPLSVEALIEPSIEVPATNVLSTVVIVPPSGPSVSVEDYENPDLVDVVPKVKQISMLQPEVILRFPNWMMKLGMLSCRCICFFLRGRM